MIQLDKDSKNVFVLAAGKITKVGVADGKAEPVKFSAFKEFDGARSAPACSNISGVRSGKNFTSKT